MGALTRSMIPSVRDSFGERRDRARRHACKRARERFGLSLTVADILEIERQLRAGPGPLKANSHGEIHRIAVAGIVIFPVVSIGLTCVVTILPTARAFYGRHRNPDRSVDIVGA